MMNYKDYVTHELNGVYRNTNTGVEFTATINKEEEESVTIEKENTRPTSSFKTQMDLSEFKFNATITGSYTQIQTETHETITAFAELLQDSISVRTLEELIRCEGISLTPSEVADLEMPESTRTRTERVDIVFKNFVDYGIAERISTNNDEETAYRLDTDHLISEHLIALQAKLTANSELMKETVKPYTTGFWTPSQFGWFTELFHQRSLQNAIMFLLGYPDDKITISDLLLHSDVDDDKQRDVITALINLNIITGVEDKIQKDRIEDIKTESVTVDVTHSVLSQLQHGLYEYHAQKNEKKCEVQ